MVGAVAAVSLGTTTLPAIAAESRVVGQIAGSGLVFKDTLTIESFEDPKVSGVLNLVVCGIKRMF
jgi:catabolite regulation protein CreA